MFDPRSHLKYDICNVRCSVYTATVYKPSIETAGLNGVLSAIQAVAITCLMYVVLWMGELAHKVCAEMLDKTVFGETSPTRTQWFWRDQFFFLCYVATEQVEAYHAVGRCAMTVRVQHTFHPQHFGIPPPNSKAFEIKQRNHSVGP